MTFFEFTDRVCGRCGKTWSALGLWAGDMVCHECGRDDYNAGLVAMNVGRPYRIDTIGGACPTQAEGEWVDGRQFYFRARHGDYTLQVGQGSGVGGEYIDSGYDPSHGSMNDADVLAILDRAAEATR